MLHAPRDRPVLGVARLADPNDKYLLRFTRVDNNPVVFDGSPAAFPGQIFKSNDHWNFIMQGDRYQSNDTVFHNWSVFPLRADCRPDGSPACDSLLTLRTQPGRTWGR